MSRLREFKQALFGKPIATKHAHHERLPVPIGLAVFASDALSSVAYATEEILIVLVATSVMADYYKLAPVTFALAALMVIVGFSYFQTIAAYPKGGGTYLVSTENLGSGPGRIAGASLLIDYVLTVAVSVSSGAAALVSVWPQLQPYMVQIGLVAVGILCLANLRGAKESGVVFAVPTYSFVAGVLVVIAATFFNPNAVAAQPNLPPPQEGHAVGLFLILRAFAASCTALTGTEAIADGVQAFKEPAYRNAQKTLALMIGTLLVMFIGLSMSAMKFGVVPMHSDEPGYRTVLAQIAAVHFGTGPMFTFILIATALILFLAANTAFADFPRLCSFIAKDGFLPRQLMSLGDRLVFQNGIILLSIAAAGLIVLYRANTHSLIPLYALGVFISFTLSQAGVTVKFLKDRAMRSYRLDRETQAGEQVDRAAVESGRRKLLIKAIVTGFGSIVTFAVAVVLLVTKFDHGAWIIALAIGVFYVIFAKVKSHYNHLAKELSVTPTDKMPPMETTTLLLVPRVHKGILKAIKYAQLSSPDCRALHITLDPASAKTTKAAWEKFGADMPLVILESPYRSLVEPVMEYIDAMIERNKDLVVTVIVPQAVPRHWFQGLLHNNAARVFTTSLKSRKNIVVTNVRYFLD